MQVHSGGIGFLLQYESVGARHAVPYSGRANHLPIEPRVQFEQPILHWIHMYTICKKKHNQGRRRPLGHSE